MVHLQYLHLRAVCFTGLFCLRYKCIFFRLKSSNRFSVKLIFGRSFIFCNFVCNHGALILRLQVLVRPASVTMARPAKTSQKLNNNRLVCELNFFDSYKSSNVFFRFTFFYSGARIPKAKKTLLVITVKKFELANPVS